MAMLSEGSMSAEAEAGAPAPDAAGGDVDAEVLIVGAGPVGCWLAAELCAAGVRVLVLEAREVRVAWSRGFVVHPRTLEILDSRAAATPMLEAGRQLPSWHFAMGTRRLDFTVLPTAFPFLLLQPQVRTEELLEKHLEKCGGAVLRGRRVVGLEQGDDRVAVRVVQGGSSNGNGNGNGADSSGAEERTLTARFVVGCDGARSTVRQAAGIDFTGNPDTMVSPTALVELADPPHSDQYMQTREHGLFFAIPLPDGRFVISTVDHVTMRDVATPWTTEMLRDSLRRITGSDYGMGEPERISTIGNSAKQAHRYRERRVLLAGDAAHVHFPMGGQGMNLGIQDAHNLAWRLTGAVRDSALADVLLDGYEAERRPAGEHVLEDVRAQMALVSATGADGAALRSRFEALLSEHPEVNAQYARRLSGLAVRYPGASEDLRIGARVPDLLLDGLPDRPDRPGPTNLYELLREVGPARFVRLDLSGGAVPPEKDAMHAPFDVVTIAAREVLGPDWAVRQGWDRAESILIRPDGHVAAIEHATTD
jgi:2-polyprenyl-6-methoxyphenol hydroxylase-like FAD-dependent oxidoreductase